MLVLSHLGEWLDTRSAAYRNITRLMTIGYFCIIPLTVGLAAIRLAPGIAEPEQVLILRAEHYLPGILYIVFAGALVSAILSTVDSALLVSGSLLAHNVVLPVLPHVTERTRLTVNRAAVAAFGLLAYVLALSAPSVYGLVEQASAFGGARRATAGPDAVDDRRPVEGTAVGDGADDAGHLQGSDLHEPLADGHVNRHDNAKMKNIQI